MVLPLKEGQGGKGREGERDGRGKGGGEEG